MKKLSIFLAVVLAVASAFTNKAGVTTYHLFSVKQDQVNVSGSTPNTMSSYTGQFETDLVALRSNDIGSAETIAQWIASNPIGQNQLSNYCTTTDVDHVCLVKFTRVDGVNTSVLQFICGDSFCP